MLGLKDLINTPLYMWMQIFHYNLYEKNSSTYQNFNKVMFIDLHFFEDI
jgi:hypothetical protein